MTLILRNSYLYEQDAKAIRDSAVGVNGGVSVHHCGRLTVAPLRVFG